ncbi:glycosyltransferase [Thalassorhabdus alkalitolerans]|uniref:Glycosyltransferase n=1 Tax=Thalassorhabdus alkalitolerans TaxID=2282697 RepID=A0ABW0YLZ9_9BACI
MKKVLFCESGYNRFYGAQQSLYNFLVNVDKESIEAVVLCPNKGKFTEEINRVNIPVEIVSYPKVLDKTGEEAKSTNLITKVKMLIGGLRYLKKYMKYFKRNKVDLVYCNDIRSILTCGLAARLSGIPVLWYVRINKKLGVYNHIGANIASKIVVIADNVKTIFNDKYIFNAKEKFSTIYTGINLKEVDSVEETGSLIKELNLSPEIKLVGIIASIQPRKGQKDLVKSIVSLKKERCKSIENTKFLIIGDTQDVKQKEYLKEVKEIIKENNLQENVLFLGWRQDVLQILKQIHLLVLPSYSEGLPRTVLESLACNCPVIATNVAGTGEIINHKKNGMLVSPGDIEGLAKSLKYMLEDNRRLNKMGNEGRKTIEKKFEMEKYISELKEIVIKTAK